MADGTLNFLTNNCQQFCYRHHPRTVKPPPLVKLTARERIFSRRRNTLYEVVDQRAQVLGRSRLAIELFSHDPIRFMTYFTIKQRI